MDEGALAFERETLAAQGVWFVSSEEGSQRRHVLLSSRPTHWLTWVMFSLIVASQLLLPVCVDV